MTNPVAMSTAKIALGLLATSFAVGSPAATPAPQEAILGVLEEQVDNQTAKRTAYVRALFHKVGAKWKAYDPSCAGGRCFPRQTQWTVGLDGRSMGQVRGVTPARWKLMGEVGRQSIPAGATAPFVGKRSETFSGWTGGAVHRPLVSTSTGHVSDPEVWKRAPLPAPLAKAMRDRMRAKFRRTQRCASAEENVPAAWAYGDADLVVDGSYASRSDWRIARVGLKADDYRCDGMIPTAGESPFSALTVAISPDGKMIDLGFDMQLLDAGDYDGDGRSELVFIYSHYNSDGYKLFANGFADSATFGYSFH